MLGRDAFVAEVAIDLVHAVHAAHHQPLQVKLGRDAQIKVHVERVVVGDEWLGHRAAGDGMHHRRLDLDEAVAVEEAPHRLHDFGALQKDLAHVGIHGEVNVAAAIARLHVLQPVPFFRQRKQVLHQEGDLLDMDGQLVGAGAEEVALHADVVAEVEQLVELKRLFADIVEADINLKPLAALLQMGEACFSLHADRHQASGDADVHRVAPQARGRSWPSSRRESGERCGWFRSDRDRPAAPALQSASAFLCGARRFSGQVPM